MFCIVDKRNSVMSQFGCFYHRSNAYHVLRKAIERMPSLKQCRIKNLPAGTEKTK